MLEKTNANGIANDEAVKSYLTESFYVMPIKTVSDVVGLLMRQYIGVRDNVRVH